MKKLIKQRIKGAMQDLHDFHQNTFDYEECEWLKDKEELTGQEIYDYTYDMEMTKQEDACYMVGKIDVYEDMQRELEEIAKGYEDLRSEVFKLLANNKIGVKRSYSLQVALAQLNKLINQ